LNSKTFEKNPQKPLKTTQGLFEPLNTPKYTSKPFGVLQKNSKELIRHSLDSQSTFKVFWSLFFKII